MKKNILITTTLVLSTMFFTGCGGGGGSSQPSLPTVATPTYAAPSASFTYSATSAGVVLTSTSANSNNIANYQWSIGNNTSTSNTLVMTTYNAGTYIATLTITDTQGNTYVVSKNITFEYGSDGYNLIDFDNEGYDRSGYNVSGYNRNGFNSSGYDSNGYDSNGYDSSGYKSDGYTVDGFDTNGVAKTEIINSINYTQGTRSVIPTTIETAEYANAGYLAQIHADEAYSRGWTGEGVTVAVIDSGIDSDHPDLDDNLIGTYSTISDNSTEDVLGHGTHVAGIIAAEKNDLGVHGLAYNSKIISIKAFQDNGSVLYADLGEAAVIAAHQGAKVANISAAGTVWFTEYFGAIVDDFRTALDADTTLVFAAGNNALGDAEYPAKLPSITEYADLLTKDGAYFSVGAVDSNNNLTSYSNEAGVAANWHIMAPGNIYSTYLNGTYIDMQGTSMAAPVITASVAIMAQRFPYLKGNQIQDIMFATTTDLGDPGVDAIYGQGLLNFEKAMAPIGDIVVPTGASVASTTVSTIGTSLTASSAMNSQAIASALTNVMVLDDYSRDYYTNIGSAVVNTIPKPDLFDYHKVNLSDNLFIGLDQSTQSASIGTYYNNFDISFTQTNDLFGSEGSGVLALDNAKTNYLSVGYPLNNQWRFATTYGNGTAKGSGLITDVSTVQSLSAKVEYRSNNLNFGIKSPEQIISGTMNLKIPTSRTLDGIINYENKTIAMNGNNQVEVYARYNHKF